MVLDQLTNYWQKSYKDLKIIYMLKIVYVENQHFDLFQSNLVIISELIFFQICVWVPRDQM